MYYSILRAMIQNMLYPVSLETLYQLFNRFGPVLKIITFTKNGKYSSSSSCTSVCLLLLSFSQANPTTDKFQALIQMKDATCAQAAKSALHAHSIYATCCSLHIDYSKLNTLNVKYNNEKSRDYTNPLLPAGECPDPFVYGPSSLIGSPLHTSISMAALAAAAAAAGYATSPATFATASLPTSAGSFQLAPAATTSTTPFLSYTGKYFGNLIIICSKS